MRIFKKTVWEFWNTVRIFIMKTWKFLNRLFFMVKYGLWSKIFARAFGARGNKNNCTFMNMSFRFDHFYIHVGSKYRKYWPDLHGRRFWVRLKVSDRMQKNAKNMVYQRSTCTGKLYWNRTRIINFFRSRRSRKT